MHYSIGINPHPPATTTLASRPTPDELSTLQLLHSMEALWRFLTLHSLICAVCRANPSSCQTDSNHSLWAITHSHLRPASVGPEHVDVGSQLNGIVRGVEKALVVRAHQISRSYEGEEPPAPGRATSEVMLEHCTVV
jgi:hypothetical protein